MLVSLFIAAALAATPTSGRVAHVKQELRNAGVPKEYVTKLFSDKRLKIYPASVVPRVTPEREKFSANILAVESVSRGTQFIEEHRDKLESAEAAYGVPKEEIVAVLRVESNLGSYLGTLAVMNVFYTRLVTSPEEKWQWDAANLAALGKYCYTANTDCFSIKGSPAGAFGLAQFLPYSAITWGVDGNQDGVVNLFDPADGIPSAANFLREHGWSDDKTGALARYYGSGRTYPATVLGYAEALREYDAKRVTAQQSAQEKVSAFITPALVRISCLFSSIPYCQR